MTRRFAAAVLAGILILAAAVVARQQRGGRGGTPQTILSVVVEVGQSSVQALSARAVRGLIRSVDQDALSKAPSGPTDALIEYIASSKSAPAGTAAFTSVFHVSFAPIVEERTGKNPPGPPNKPVQSVTIAIALPDLPADAVISFSRLTPTPGVPSGKWDRTPMGQSPLPPVAR